jgi:hypothetical protein
MRIAMTASRRRLLEDRPRRGLAPKTQLCEVAAVPPLARPDGRPPDPLGDAARRQSVLGWLHETNVAASTLRLHREGSRCFDERTLQRPWPVVDLGRPRRLPAQWPSQRLGVVLLPSLNLMSFGGISILINCAAKEAAIVSRATKLMAGLILLAIPTIQYGGFFLLTQLMDRESGYMANALRQNFFRAGHAHAGVLTLLSLIVQVLVDAANLSSPLQWLVRFGVPIAGILISAGFFFSVASPTTTEPNQAVYLIYLGAVSLAVSVITLGIGLLRAK